MATISSYLDKRNGKARIKLVLNHKSNSYYISIEKELSAILGNPLTFTERDWNKNKKEFKHEKNLLIKANLIIKEFILRGEKFLATQDVQELSGTYLFSLVKEVVFGREINSESLWGIWEKLIADKHSISKAKTATSYESAFNAWKRYMPNDIPVNKITYLMLEDFEVHLRSNGVTSAVANYMRVLRIVINKARKAGTISKYPFDNYRIKKVKTVKRAIQPSDIAAIKNLSLNPYTAIWHQRNFFMFIFYMQGMNFIDLAELEYKDIVGDRVYYKRLKVGKHFSIKLTEDAKRILAYYPMKKKPTEKVFPIYEGCKHTDPAKVLKFYEERRKVFNRNMKTIAKMLGMNVNLTSYVARHTFATMLKKAGVSTSVISSALGHETESTTQTYLDEFENKVVDDANDLVQKLI